MHPGPAPAKVAPVTDTSTVAATAAPADWRVRYVARTSTTDATGRVWQPDSAVALGGTLAQGPGPISGTSSSLLYQAERRGLTGYAVPVPAQGTYAVDLLLAETASVAPGARVFDVTAEGQVRAASVDIARQVGNRAAHHVVFTVAVSDGKLNLGFVRRIGTPKSDALQVSFVSSSLGSLRATWSDEFTGVTGAAPNPAVWQPQTGGRWGNGKELQQYTGRPQNVSLDGAGHLAITARRETYTGPDGVTNQYTSARIITQGTVSATYGQVSAVLRPPVGKGLWPAFWMLGTDIDRVGWPACGEVDVFEDIGSEPMTNVGSLHGPTTSGGEYVKGAEWRSATTLSSAWHRYAVTRLPDVTVFSVDGSVYATQDRADLATGQVWAYDKPMYLLLNMAVGGDWPGAPDSSTVFPATLLVDSASIASW